MKWVSLTGATLAAIIAWPVSAAINGVYQRGYDRYQSGANLNETILNTSNVNFQQFGKLFSMPVDGLVFAQPLYVSNVTVPGNASPINLLLVATMEDSVYAFNADTGAQIWKHDFKTATVFAMPIADALQGLANYGDIDASSDVGIQGTPVINPSSNTIYFVTRTKEYATNGSYAYYQRFRALNIVTGQELSGSGQAITATDPSSGITFSSQIQMQRPALVISNGQVVACWGSHEDNAYYHGWIITFDSQTLQQTGSFAITTTAGGGSVWQGGRPPSLLPNGDIIVLTANTSPDSPTAGFDGVSNFAESMLQLTPSAHGLTLVHYFTPSNWAALDAGDIDFGSTGPITIPNANNNQANTWAIAGEGKDGNVYVENYPGAVSGLMSSSQTMLNIGLDPRGGFVYWDKRPIGGTLRAYSATPGQTIQAWDWNGVNNFNLTPALDSGVTLGGYPGGIFALSANGTTAGSGILWSLSSTQASAEHNLRGGALRAYNADTLSPLWDSITYSSDDLGYFAKFNPPTVANGKVYVPSFSKTISAYGLIAPNRPLPTFANYVKIVSRVDPSQVLEVAGASQSPLSRIQLGQDAGWSRQRWRLVIGNGGKIYIQSALNPNMVLDPVAATAYGQNPGVSVALNTASTATTQQWAPVQHGNYYVIVAGATGNALTLPGGLAFDSAALQTSPANGSTAQDWMVVPEPDAGLSECSPHVIIKSRASGNLLTFPPGATNNTLAVVAQPYLGTLDQVFNINTNLDGSYTFTSATSGLTLNVSSVVVPGGAEVVSNQSNGSSAQHWYIDGQTYTTSGVQSNSGPNPNNGYFQMVSVWGQQLFNPSWLLPSPIALPVLDVYLDGMTNGTPLDAITPNNAFSQDWAIYDALTNQLCRFRPIY